MLIHHAFPMADGSDQNYMTLHIYHEAVLLEWDLVLVALSSLYKSHNIFNFCCLSEVGM